jgi:hypothetical protein
MMGLSGSAQMCKIEPTSLLEYQNDSQGYDDDNCRKTEREGFTYLTNLLPIFILLSIFGVRHVGFRSETSRGPRQSCGDMAVIFEIPTRFEPEQMFSIPQQQQIRSITVLARWHLSDFVLATGVRPKRHNLGVQLPNK